MKTPLTMFALQSEGTEDEIEQCIELLIRKGADLNLRDKDNQTALDYPRVQRLKQKKTDLFRINDSTN